MGMTRQEEERIWAALTKLNAEFGWEMDGDMFAAYAQALQRITVPGSADEKLHRVACNYHADHALVEALLHHEHAQHAAMWERWALLARAIIRRAGAICEFDSAVGLEDLVQVASMELARSLPHYRYVSRFSTWAHQVLVQSVLRYLRALRAQKRYNPLCDYDDLSSGQPAPPQLDPETYSQGSALLSLVHGLLHMQPDPRLAQIFYLWAIADCRISEIGAYVGLSESRVRVLLNHSRRILAASPDVCDWANPEPARMAL